ncbi:LacI family DNA-binding transcriptional regulator [Treponema sp. HNW]|uniref:LacI family DNA-binding transcriptional regulator n=1 Tax=Treponema sp. HNW TaxID=3116654 RepID=UPI003D121975
MRKNGATLKDIAAMTGFSPASISMVLSGKMLERFSDKTIREIRSAAKQCNYGKGAQGSIVLVICPSVFNPYYSTILQGMDMEAAKHGLSTIVYNTYWDAEKEKKVLGLAKNPAICGAVFAMIPQIHETAVELNKIIPVVAIGDYHKDLQLDAVDINNFNAGKLLAEHLISLGHKTCAYISTTLNDEHSARTQRLEGLRAAYREAGIPEYPVVYSRDIEPEYELHNVNVEYETGYNLMLDCIKKTAHVTAVVAINDMVAYGCMNAIRDKGFRVPEDYSLCGFDNIFPSKFCGIELTSVEHHIIERGKKAIEILAARPENRSGILDVVRIEYKSGLIVRRSTAQARSSECL